MSWLQLYRAQDDITRLRLGTTLGNPVLVDFVRQRETQIFAQIATLNVTDSDADLAKAYRALRVEAALCAGLIQTAVQALKEGQPDAPIPVE